MSDEHREMENGPMPALMERPSGLSSASIAAVPPACRPDDGQLNLPNGGHAELPSGGQRDYFAWLPPAAGAPLAAVRRGCGNLSDRPLSRAERADLARYVIAVAPAVNDLSCRIEDVAGPHTHALTQAPDWPAHRRAIASEVGVGRPRADLVDMR
jgi:hypothetical protein